MNYTDFKKQADLDNMIYRIGSKFDNSGYRNPLLGASNSIKAKAPLLTAPTVQDKTDFMNVAKKAPAQQRANWFLNPGDSNLKLPVEQSPREYVQANLNQRATPPWKANQAVNTTQTTVKQQTAVSNPQQVNQQGAITRSVYPMRQGANRTMSAADIAPEPNKQQPTKQPPAQKSTGYSVDPNAFRDPESIKKFLESMPGIVSNKTSTAGKLQSVDTSTALAQFSKEHPFLTAMLPGGSLLNIASAFGFGKVDDNEKAAVFQKFKEENPNFMPSLVEAVKKGSPEAIKELQQISSGKGGASMFNDDEMKQITGAAKSASWNAIKSDPLGNLPKVMGLFLRQQGLGGAAEYAENPMVFYGGLLALLFGGGAMLSGGFGGSSQQQPQVVNNYYGQQPQRGFNTFA